MKKKSQMMAERRSKLEQLGLERVECYVPPASRARLENYVRKYLCGKVQTKRRKRD